MALNNPDAQIFIERLFSYCRRLFGYLVAKIGIYYRQWMIERLILRTKLFMSIFTKCWLNSNHHYSISNFALSLTNLESPA